MSSGDGIEEFCKYFAGQANAIASVMLAPASVGAKEAPGSHLRFQKILCVAQLDSLAGFRYHKSVFPSLHRENRERFTRFIRDHANWRVSGLVSLPFLAHELRDLKRTESPLGRYVSAKIPKQTHEDGGTLLASKIDVPAVDLFRIASSEKEEEAIERYQHVSLLYRYRNSLVHEGVEPGYSMEIRSVHEGPFYHSYLGRPDWHLVYPVRMFVTLLQDSIESFRDYLIENSIDPYSMVKDHAPW
jgi:hypothetical protein